MSQEVITMKSVNPDSYFLPLLSDAEVMKIRDSMTKSEFKKCMDNENKKALFNEKLSKYAMESRSEIRMCRYKKDDIKTYNDLITNLQTQTNTFTGSIVEIQKHLNDLNKRISNYKDSKKKATQERLDIAREHNKKEKEFDRVNCIVKMEVELYQNNNERRNVEIKQAEDPMWKDFLKRLNAIPDEVLRIIRSYFTEETRGAILEKIYQPIKLYHKLKKNTMKKTIFRIYNKYYTQCNDYVLKDKLMYLWKKFYKDSHISNVPYHSASIKDMKIMIEYLFMLFHEHHYTRCSFEMYRTIVVMKHKK